MRELLAFGNPCRQLADIAALIMVAGLSRQPLSLDKGPTPQALIERAATV